MKFLKTLLILPVFLAGLTAPALAQTKVGVIHEQRVIQESVVGQHIAARLNEIRQEIAAELSAMNVPIQQATEQLNAETAIMTQEQVTQRPDLVQRIQVLNQQIQQFEVARRVREQEFQFTERQAMVPVLEALQPILAEVVELHQLDILIDRSNLVFANASVDVSTDVISRLDQRLPSVPVNRVRMPADAAAGQAQ